MSAQKIDRIVVALDSSPASQAALEAAVELALGFKARLVGLFVEDINLVRLAEISFTQEVGLFSGASRRLEVQYIERQFRSQARQARQALERLAHNTDLEWTFQVVRGNIATELLAAASEADLIILGKVGWSPLGRKRLGSTVRAVLSEGAQLTLVLQHGIRLGMPVLLVYDGSVAAQKGLVIATEFVEDEQRQVTVLVLGEDGEATQSYEQEAMAWLKSRGIEADYLRQVGLDAEKVAHTVQEVGCHLLILPGDESLLNVPSLMVLLEELECPALLVR